MFKWSRQQGEDVLDTSLVLRAVKSVFNNACQSARTMDRSLWKPYKIYLVSRISLLRPDSLDKSWGSSFGGCVHDHTKKRKSDLFLFFFVVIFVSQWPKNPQKTSSGSSLSKNNHKNKKPFFRVVMKNIPAKFRFPTLLQSGRKSLKPKCSCSVFFSWHRPIYQVLSLLIVRPWTGWSSNRCITLCNGGFAAASWYLLVLRVCPRMFESAATAVNYQVVV